MTIWERGNSFGVRVYTGQNTWRWVGSYPTRAEAEEAERLAKPSRRRACAKCGRSFRPQDDRRVRCEACVKRSNAGRASQDDHWLYRCFNAAGELLYVGITSAGIKRFRNHGNDKSWWCDVETIKLEHFETREQVRAAEAEAVRTEAPRYNVDLQAKPKPLPYFYFEPWEGGVELVVGTRKDGITHQDWRSLDGVV